MSLVSRDPFQLQGRYAERNRWEVLGGPGDARPTGLDIIHDEDLEGQWADKVFFVTGVSSGSAVEIVKALLATGATVYGTARNLAKAEGVLGPELATRRLHLLLVDQADLKSVRACAAEFLKQSSKLNGFIGSAAVMNTPESSTVDGFELQFGTNVLSHFLLFSLLKDTLVASSTPAYQSRVVLLTSLGHRYAPFNFANYNFTGEYDGWRAYGSSKTALIYLVNQIERLYGTQGLHSYAVHPGAFVSPNLQQYSATEMAAAESVPRFSNYMCSTEQACATSIYAVAAKDLEGRGGLYLEGASVTVRQLPEDADGVEYGYAGWAYNQENEEKLWDLVGTLTGVA